MGAEDRQLTLNFTPELRRQFFVLSLELRATLSRLHVGAALRLADALDKGNMAEAASRLGDIAAGCVACHEFFRGRPGISQLLLPAARK